MEEKHSHHQAMGDISRSVLVVMALTMVGKVAGFVREMALARTFGAAQLTDVIKTASELPTFFLGTISIALAAALIPAYAARRKAGKAHADRFINNLLTFAVLFAVPALLVTVLLYEPLVKSFLLVHTDQETQRLAIHLGKLMMPMAVFALLARISSAYLQANFNFTIPAVSQIFFNLVVIAAILLSSKVDATYVAIGTVIGWAAQFAVHLPKMRKLGLAYRPILDAKEPGLRQTLILMAPVLVSSAFDQVYMSFDRSIASQVAGDISMLDYANRLSMMVSAILVTTIATVFYPSLVRDVDDRGAMSGSLSFGINLNLLIALPASAALVLLCTPITRLVYERGGFTPENTAATAPLLACYAAGIFGVGLRELCNRCFYAFGDVRAPTVVGVLVVAMKIALNYLLYPVLDAAGLAAATTISSLTSGFILLLLLHRRRRVIDGNRIGRCLWKALAATAAMCATLLALSGALSLPSLGGMAFYAAMAGTIVAGIGVYGLVLLLLGTEELRMAVSMIRNRLKRG